MADDTSAQPDPTLSDDITPPSGGGGETPSPSWLERMEARRTGTPQGSDNLPVHAEERRPVAVVGPDASYVPAPADSHSPVADLQEVGVTRLRPGVGLGARG